MGTQTSELLQAIEQKNFQNFLKRIGRGSEGTKALYGNIVRLFTTFLQKPQPDDAIADVKEAKVDPYNLLDAFIGWLLDQGYSSNYTLTAVSIVKKWFWYNDIEVYREKIANKVELPKAEQAADDAPSKTELRKILAHMRFETQNKMLVLGCSGIRPVDIRFLRWSDFKWDEHPVRLIVQPRGKTKRGWETFITDELAERLKTQANFKKTERLWESGTKTECMSEYFKLAAKASGLLVVGRESNRSPVGRRYKLHLYSLKKFFNTNTKAEVGETFALAWQGRKAYLSTYDRFKLEEKQKAYLKIMPRLTIFASEPMKPEDRLRERLKTKGLSDEIIDNVLEGLVLN